MSDTVTRTIPTDPREIIASRIALEMHGGFVVTLGIGIPALVSNYIPERMGVVFQCDNGMAGMGPPPEAGREDKNFCNANGDDVTVIRGASIFDCCEAFSMIRGGHLHIGVLGAFEVDGRGRIASYSVPGVRTPGMGGAMEVLAGARRVIVAMRHSFTDPTTGRTRPKIVNKCSIPLTGERSVDMIVTEMGVIKCQGGSLILSEIHPKYTLDDVIAATGAPLSISLDMKVMAGFESIATRPPL